MKYERFLQSWLRNYSDEQTNLKSITTITTFTVTSDTTTKGADACVNKTESDSLKQT